MSDSFSKRLLSCTLLCLIATFGAGSAHAALKAKGSASTVGQAVNPNPKDDDIILPMPCGGEMVFKAVGTQAEGYLWDLETLLGCDDCDRQGNDYYERRYSTAISGPFSQADLPKSWQVQLPKAEVGGYFYYLIGKYEVTNFQWKAVMENACPSDSTPLTAEDTLPKTAVSWFDAIAFTQKYMDWLLANSPEALPKFSGDGKNIGYIRLPTEAEWEYAARGGHKVTRTDLRDQNFFPLSGGSSLDDYAVYRSEKRIEESLQPIGSRKPNPLGLYDTAGNASEMVFDMFHFSLGGRLHGSAGGFIKKGGSFLSPESGILPGRREEVAFYQENGPAFGRDMGLRLALSGINTPGGERPAQLEKEWKKAGEGEGRLLDQGKNPLEELDRIIASAKSSTEKENLQRIRNILKDNNIALERQNEAAADGLIRSSLFIEETVKNYAIRHKNIVNLLDNAKKEQETAKKMSAEAQKAVKKTIDQLEANRLGMKKSVDAAVMFYRSKIEDSRSYPEKMFNDRLKILAKELAGDDLMASSMRKAHEIYSKHVQMLRQGKQGTLTKEYLLRDILPENLHDGLGITEK